MVTRIFSDRFEFHTGLSTIWSPHKILIVILVCRTEISDRFSFKSVWKKRVSKHFLFRPIWKMILTTIIMQLKWKILVQKMSQYDFYSFWNFYYSRPKSLARIPHISWTTCFTVQQTMPNVEWLHLFFLNLTNHAVPLRKIYFLHVIVSFGRTNESHLHILCVYYSCTTMNTFKYN